MRRFRIRSLMAAVLALAVGLAALRNADDHWAGGTLLATSLLLGLAALGACVHEGRTRAARLGFVVFGGGYFALAFLGLSEADLNRLPTNRLLVLVHDRFAPPEVPMITFSTTPGGSQGTVILSQVSGTVATSSFAFTATPVAAGTSPSRWSRLLPGAADFGAFRTVGHCLFAIVAGLLGAAIALRMWAKSDRGKAMAQGEESGPLAVKATGTGATD